MTRIEDIESRIRELSTDELNHLRRWFLEFDADAWERQLQEDVRDGKLDSLAHEALAADKSGRSTVL